MSGQNYCRAKEFGSSDEEYFNNDRHEFDCYGKTPPRTKILRKLICKKNRDKENLGFVSKPSPKMDRKVIKRRNTATEVFNDLMSKVDSDPETVKRGDKRSIKLLRNSERDLKLDIASAQASAEVHNGNIPMTPHTRAVECSKRFLCLQSKRVATTSVRSLQRTSSIDQRARKSFEPIECPNSRVEFYDTLSLLIKMGCGDKNMPDRNARRHLSREEFLWQTELKDLIWLELQAWHADRTPSEEDEFLCSARESVGSLLNYIMSYKFDKQKKRLSAQSRDSGVEDDCYGCLSMYCQCCMEAQNDALKDVEELMDRLEAAESLFPSSRAFANAYPLYNSPEFVGRVKAMCLWYNMTRHQRLKLVILGKLLALLENKYYQWPIPYDGSSIDSTSPTDSNSSNSSVNDYLNDSTPVDFYNIGPIASLVSKKYENKASPYRKYIENILKTRGLSKSMSFLDRLHKHVLKKAHITLIKPEDEEIFNKIPGDDQDEELRRYGSWSPEAKSLQLPSYRSSFLFLSAVPLEVVHEFIHMRLEQKPENPSPLSVRQLMRELKEGIRIATTQKQSFKKYMDTILNENEDNGKYFLKSIETFDNSLLLIFKDYLEYMGTWALLQHDTFQKSLLEEEWKFISEVYKIIPNGLELLRQKFCSILAAMLNLIGTRLINRIDELSEEINSKDDDLNRKQNLLAVCRELQYLFNDEREMSIKIIGFTKSLYRNGVDIYCMEEFKAEMVALKCTVPKAIKKVQNICDFTCLENMDETEKASFISRCREILMQGFRFGFEFHKEMTEFVSAERKKVLAGSMVQFAHLWMKFVQERCERGRGKRPRWAYQGLDFLLTVCDPEYTRFLSEEEFEELKKDMDRCISHVIGTTAPTTPDSGIHSSSPRPILDLGGRFPKSRGSSPSPRPTYRSQRSAGRKTSCEQNSPLDQIDSPNFDNSKVESLNDSLIKIQQSPALRVERIREAVESLETSIDNKLREQELIGTVKSKEPIGVKHIRRRNVTFRWQRGIKIGQGRFGKVYTAVNNDTGEMMAVKEVAIQHNDGGSIRQVTEELKIMEGISHKNLVKYYGLEVRKEEMLIFMEFCPEGTLETLVAATENGLPELLIRRYTFQLLSGLSILHDHGIVHRDIKTANIFLSDEGNCLKIGDFGSAVKIKSHVTMPGELKGFVGTQAYMAPEVFMKTSDAGHGRAADVWSAGCVVVEMASGKRPWAEYDSNYQIMFKVGMGDKPEAPDHLIEEGHDFLELCFQHDPKKRATVFQLLDHNFVKIGDLFS